VNNKLNITTTKKTLYLLQKKIVRFDYKLDTDPELDPDPNPLSQSGSPDPDPVPHQNEADPKHWYYVSF